MGEITLRAIEFRSVGDVLTVAAEQWPAVTQDVV